MSEARVEQWKRKLLDLSHRFSWQSCNADPFVSHLTDGVGLYNDEVDVFPPDQVERYFNPSKNCCPMSADSSQLAAVIYSLPSVAQTFTRRERTRSV